MVFKIKKEKLLKTIKSINIKDHNNNDVDKIDINVFEDINNNKIAKVIKWQLSKSRLGTHHTKDVSELAYSTKKLRKQKGGGCARFRNKGAPQFKGGATVHGPDDRIYEYSINKKEKKLGLIHALSFKVKENNLIILKDLNINETVKSFKIFLQKHNMDNNIRKNKILLIDTEKKTNILHAINNVYGANFLPTVGLNVKSIAESSQIICTEKAIIQLKERGIF